MGPGLDPNSVPTRQPKPALLPTFSSQWPFTRAPDAFRVETNPAERRWESSRFPVGSGLKPGVIDVDY